ncbi:MAG: choice-of-anchor D domain-containing protein [Planctomycetota bacterium]
MKYLITLTMFVFAGLLTAQDYGDAPASYGLPAAGSTAWNTLGVTGTNDTSNPVTPAWTGDSDDGVVGNPIWNPWSSFNQLTVHVENEGYLYMFVDADDSGTFDPAELYIFGRPGFHTTGPKDVTFEDIELKKQGGYSLNGQNKVAVRIIFYNNIGTIPNYVPNETFYFGEIEDWLIDTTPPVLVVSEDSLEDGEEAQSYSTIIQPIDGSGPYNWTQTSGSLPAGVSLVQVGDNFELTGTPAVGSAGVYSIDVQVTDGTSAVASQSYVLRVLPVPYATPFVDDFSSNLHWTLNYDWTIAPATGFAGTGSSGMGYPAVEPPQDFTKGNTDNNVLMSSPGAIEPDRPKVAYATSAKINCTNLSSVQLEFRRWYSIYSFYDFVSIEITSDNVNWEEIWLPPTDIPGNTNGGRYRIPIADVTWSKIQVDISQWAANKQWIRLRWRAGWSVHYANTGSSYGPHSGYCGWAIDDVIVRETPMCNPLVTHDFEIQSPGSHQNPDNFEWYPIIYPGSTHDWTVKIDNPTSEDVTIDDVEVFIRFAPPPGSNNPNNPLWWWGGGVISHGDVCYDWGTWTLTQPVTIPANSTDVVVSGRFNFAGAPLNLALVPIQAYIDLIGTHGSANTPVECKAMEEFVPNVGAMPGLYLFEVQAGTTPITNGQPAANLRDFGSISINGYSSWLNIVLDNDQAAVLNLGTPAITGPDAADFILDTTGYSTQVNGNSTTYFSLMFHPTTGGQKNATVSFTHDAINTATPFTFEITGFSSVNGPVLKVFEGSAAGPQVGNGSPVGNGRDFGQQDIFTGLGQLTVVVENQGTQDLTLGAPTLTGADASHFSLDTTGMLNTVTPNGSTSFVISFDPLSIGILQAAVEFTHNDAGTANPFEINIQGEGIINAPILEVREMSPFGLALSPGAPAVGHRNFGVVSVGTGGGQACHIIIHNVGWADLVLGTPVLTGSNTGSFSINLGRFNSVVAGGGLTGFTVNFDPLAKGVKAMMVEFTHNDTNVVSPFTLNFEGIGDDPNGVQVASTSLPAATDDQPYSALLQATGGTAPYTWVQVGSLLNSGLIVDPDGTVHGTPVNGNGTINTFQVMVTDALGGTEYAFVTVLIQPPVGHLSRDPNGGSGGCVSSSGSTIWMLGLIALGVVAIRRRREAV